MHHIPALVGRHALRHYCLQPSTRSYRTHSSPLSTSHRNRAITKTNRKTYSVIVQVSFLVGQTTRLTSLQDSLPKARKRRPGSVNQATTPPRTSPPSSARMRKTIGCCANT